MNRLIPSAIACLLLTSLTMLGPASASAQAPVQLHKGTNTFPWLFRARPVAGQTDVYPLEQTFPYVPQYTLERLATLKSMGFDFVRIQTEATPFLTTAPAQRGKLIDQIVSAVDLAKQAGLNSVIVFFPRDIFPKWSVTAILASPEDRKLLGDVLVETAAALAKHDAGNAVLEMLNEPSGGYSAAESDRWRMQQKEYVKAIRRVAPNLTLLVTGDRGGGFEGLKRLDDDDVKDPRILYSFHYYDPMIITHQGAAWTSKLYRKYLSGLAYPPVKADETDALARIHDAIVKGVPDPAIAAKTWADAEVQLRLYFETPQDKSKIDKDMADVSAWAKAHHIAPERIVLGEFGIIRPGATEETAVHWIKDVRTAAERAGFSWCFFNYLPNAKAPDLSMLQLTGATPNDFDAGIVTEGLGLTLGANVQK